MNYCKLLKNKNKFKFVQTDDKMIISTDILKEIQKTKILIQNFYRINMKIDIDEYIANFLKDKNQFITEFKQFLEKEGGKLNYFERNKYIAVLEILKSNIDEVLRNFKTFKAKLYKIMNKKENFIKQKEKFIKNYKENENKNFSISTITSKFQIDLNKLNFLSEETKTNVKKPKEPLNNNQYNLDNQINLNEDDNKFKDSLEVISLFKESESKDLEKTRQTIFELSDMMTNFSTKVLEQQHLTQNSKNNS
jgi:hypothetical protein